MFFAKPFSALLPELAEGPEKVPEVPQVLRKFRRLLTAYGLFGSSEGPEVPDILLQRLVFERSGSSEHCPEVSDISGCNG